jgi:hypothetical protein
MYRSMSTRAATTMSTVTCHKPSVSYTISDASADKGLGDMTSTQRQCFHPNSVRVAAIALEWKSGSGDVQVLPPGWSRAARGPLWQLPSSTLHANSTAIIRQQRFDLTAFMPDGSPAKWVFRWNLSKNMMSTEG